MGILTRHEPTNTEALRRNIEVFSIFEEVGWTEFFQCLNVFHRETTLQFSLNLTETYLEFIGLCIEVTKDILAEVTGLSQVGRTWFGRRTHNAATMWEFLVAGEQVCQAK